MALISKLLEVIGVAFVYACITLTIGQAVGVGTAMVGRRTDSSENV